MIQRIQSLYLLLVWALLIASLFLPLGYFVDGSGLEFVFKPLGLVVKDTFHSTWGIFCILLLSAVIACCTIFLYKNRMLQIRMTIFNSILLIGYYCAFLAFMFMLKSDLDASFRLSWALSLPLVSIILNYLALRAIGRDEVMVKAADRLR